MRNGKSKTGNNKKTKQNKNILRIPQRYDKDQSITTALILETFDHETKEDEFSIALIKTQNWKATGIAKFPIPLQSNIMLSSFISLHYVSI